MNKNKRTLLLRITVTVALLPAIFGSFCLARCMTAAHAVTLQPIQFPRQFSRWTMNEQARQTSLADAIAREYRSDRGEVVEVVVRRNSASAVLHDLTSCLMSIQANPVILRGNSLQTELGPLHSSLVAFNQDHTKKLALMWFQAGSETASNRWNWRWLSVVSPNVRDASYFWQGEVSVVATQDQEKDVETLSRCAEDLFQALASQ